MSDFLGEIYRIKGLILSRCSYYEQRMDLFIAKHFMKANHSSFTEEVLEDNYFNFELKKRIFYRLIDNYYLEYLRVFSRKDFNRLQEIRNIVAHGAIVANPENPDVKLACLRHSAKHHSIQDLLTEFEAINPTIKKAFENLPLSEPEEELEISGIG